MTARALAASVCVGDIVLWADRTCAGHIEEIVCSEKTPLHARVQRLTLEQTTAWGSIWHAADTMSWHRLDEAATWITAVWWKSVENRRWCIH